MNSVRRISRRALLALGLSLLVACCGKPDTEPVAPLTRTLPSPLWIDTRLPEPFARGHAPGALNLQWDWDQLADRVAAYVPDQTHPILLRATDDEEARKAKWLLENYGYRDVKIGAPSDESETLSIINTSELAQAIEAGEDFELIDVRTRVEFATGTIDGARLVDPDAAPLLIDELDPDKRYYLICEGGYRSGQLASLMRIHGFEDVHNVLDGMYAWRNR